MYFCPAGILCIIICMWIVFKKKELFFNIVLFSAVLEIFIGKGFLFQIGGNQIPMLYLPFSIAVLFSLLKLRKIPLFILKSWLYMIGCFCMSIILLLIFPSNAMIAAPPDIRWDDIVFGTATPVHPMVTSSVVSMTIKFILFSFVYLYIYKKWSFNDYKKFLFKLSNISNVFLGLTIIEFLAKNVFGLNSTWGEYDFLFFGETPSTVYEGRLRGLFYESVLFNTESSIHAYSLFIVSLIKFANNAANDKKYKIDKSIILCYVMMYLSTSFSSALMTITFLSIYMVYRWGILRPDSMKIEMMVTVVIVLLSLSIFSITTILGTSKDDIIASRLLNMFDNIGDYFTFDANYGQYSTFEDGSAYIRTLSIMQTLKAFLERPVFGYAIYALWCHGQTASFLASIGIVGIICWIRFYFLRIPLKNIVRPILLPYWFGVGIYMMCLFFSSGNGALRPYSYFMPLVFINCNCFIFSKNDNSSNNLLQCRK